MGTLTIRSIPDEVIEGVRTYAELHHRSMEQEVRELLQRRYGSRSEVLQRMRARWAELPRTGANEAERWRKVGRR